MERERIKQIIIQELPAIIEQEPEIRELILRLSRQHFADKTETESRFDRLLEELRRDREEQARRWEEQARKWEENQQVIRQMLRKYDSTIGALGARWGLHSEQTFRNALKAILEEFPGVQVVNVTEYDDSGEVFGHPDQVELDLIIRDGLLIIGEIKSSMSKADMYLFERKARFYEKRHGQKASRLIVISPMVDEKARKVAERLGIEVYSFADGAGKALTES